MGVFFKKVFQIGKPVGALKLDLSNLGALWELFENLVELKKLVRAS